MTTLVNSFEGGTNGTTITTGNSGGSVSGNAFDVVTIGTGSTLTFSSTHAAHGALAADVSSNASAGASFVQWSTSMGTQGQVWFRAYLYLTTNTPTNFRIFQASDAGGTNGAYVRLTTSGQLLVVNLVGNTTITTSANSIPLNQWFRVEGFILASTSVGQTELRLFSSPDSLVPTEVNTSAANQNLGTSALALYSYGLAVGVASIGPFWLDDIGLSNAGYIGPVGQPGYPPAAAVAPPGFLSPAAFPFPNGPFPLPNDAPPTTPQPYIIGVGQSYVTSTTVTINVQQATSPGDAIVVIVSSPVTPLTNNQTSDTRGNSYCAVVRQGTAGIRNAIYVAANTKQLGITDTITATFNSTTNAKNAIALGFPAGIMPVPSDYLDYDPAIINYNPATGNTELTTPAGGSVAGMATAQSSGGPFLTTAPRALIAVAVTPFAVGPPAFSQGWTVIGNVVDNTATAPSIAVAWQLMTSPVLANNQQIVTTVQGPSATSGLALIGLMGETRFASQPGVISGPPNPPGFLSPAAGPNTPPLLPTTVNDAPPTTPQPYLIAQGQKTASAQSITLPVQNASNLGDVILVFGVSSSQSQPGGVTDTKGNYYQLTAWQTSGNRSGLFAAVNPVPLTMSDSITYTWSSNVPATKDLMVIGVPAAMYAQMFPSTPGAGDPLTFDNFYGPQGSRLTVNATAQPSGVANPAAGVASSGRPALCIVVFANSGTSGSPSFGQDWIPFASFADNAGSFVMVWAYKFVSTNAQGTTLAWSQGNIGTIDMSVVSLYPETRFAAQPGVISGPPNPPGFLSPASAPDTPPMPPGTINDAPVPNAPYVVGSVAANAPLTIQVQTPTNPGDTIVVLVGAASGLGLATACTDTKGNTYSLYLFPGNAEAYQLVAVNPVPLTTSDTITVTFGVSSLARMAIAVAIPRSAVSAGPSGYAVPDNITTTASNSTRLLWPASYANVGTTPEVVLVAVAAQTSNTGVINWAPQVIPFGPVLSTGGYSLSAAWVPVASLQKPLVGPVFIFPAAGNLGAMAVSYTAETRVAPANPQLTGSLPPGMLSPAAMPFAPPTALPQAVNDAPVPQPYLIAQGFVTSGSSLTIPVTTGTSPGDAIIVAFAAPFGITGITCTDTRGNAYSLVNFRTPNLPCGQFIAQNTIPLSNAAGDSITLTVTGAPGSFNAIAMGAPESLAGSVSPFLTYDPAIKGLTGNATSFVLAASVPAAGPVLPAGDILVGMFTANINSGTVPQIDQSWTVLGSITSSNAGGYYLLTAWKPVPVTLPVNKLLIRVLVGNGGSGMAFITLTPETRFAAQPGIASNSQASPPGLMSPGAWPVLPQAPTTINDVPPPANAPYLIGTFSTNASVSSASVTVREATNPTDAIVVYSSTGGGLFQPVSCTDTQGNAYATFFQQNSAGAGSASIAQNTVPLSPQNNDSITVTWSGGHPILIIAVGVPASAAGGSSGQWLTYDLRNFAFNSASLSVPASPGTGAPGVPEVIVAFSNNATTTAGPAAFPQDFTVIGNANWTVVTAFQGAVAYKIAPAGVAANSTVVWTQQATANAVLTYVTLRLETRVAPNRPVPDMPPGMLSPGAWQFSAAQEYGLGSGIKYPSASGPIPVTPPLVDGFIMKRPPVRGVWRGEEVPFIIAVPLVGGQIVQHPHERGYWRGEDAPFLPLGEAAVGGLIIPHKHVRGFWEGKDVPFQYGKPNTGGFVAPHPHERGTWRGEDAPFIYGKPVTGGFNSVHSHERSEWRYILGQVPPPPPPAGTVPPHIFTAKRPWVRVWWKGTAPFAPAKSLGPGMSIVTGPVYLEWTTGPVEGEWTTGPVEGEWGTGPVSTG